MYYNADLLDIPKSHGDSLGFIDDIAFGVQGQTDKGNVTQLRRMLEEAETWRHKHGAQFEKSKYLLIHFTRDKKKTSSAPIIMADITIEAKDEARYLGVIFDKELRFKAHLQYVIQKGTKFALAMSNAAKSQWGAQYRYIRQLFTAVVAPRTDYGAIIWHRPSDTKSPAGKQVTAARENTTNSNENDPWMFSNNPKCSNASRNRTDTTSSTTTIKNTL